LIGIAYLIIAKHRNGATGDVVLRFQSEYAKFLNIDDVSAGEYSSSMNNPAAARPTAPASSDRFIPSESDNGMPF